MAPRQSLQLVAVRLMEHTLTIAWPVPQGDDQEPSGRQQCRQSLKGRISLGRVEVHPDRGYQDQVEAVIEGTDMVQFG